MLYESFIHPITILSTLPSAGVGALLALLLAGSDLGVIGIIGIILLIGIVKKNAIMMIDFALVAEREQGMSPRDAIYHASLLRFRPILMTTMAALLGALPLMLGTGTGSELRHPLGITIVGGLILRQLLTLFTTPVIYLYFDRLERRIGRLGRRAAGPERRRARNEPLRAVHPPPGRHRRSSPSASRSPASSPTSSCRCRRCRRWTSRPSRCSANLAGASPDVMATTVATPLERHLGQIADVTEMTSSSSAGSAHITLQFGLNRDIDGAARDVEAAINAARADLPTALRSNPTYHKVNPADAPMLILALTSTTLTPGQMYDAADTILAQKLSQVRRHRPGAGRRQLAAGGARRAQPQRAVQVRHRPRGRARGAGRGQRQHPQGLDRCRRAALPDLHQRPGHPGVRSTATWSSPTATARRCACRTWPRCSTRSRTCATSGLADGKPAVLVILYRQPGANIIETVDRVKALLPALKASIPTDIDMKVAIDRTTTIRASLHDVERTLLIAITLVILVVFLFLRNGRATLVPAVAVPISLLGTFGAMYLLGYSLDNLSLMALIIATGFVVDDAIVVLENITRHVEAGMPRFQAAIQGAREVGFTVLSMSLSLVAVFIPILLMGGIVGRLFREFSVTLSVAVLVSLLVSLTTTPMMCSRLIRQSRPARGRGGCSSASERAFEAMLRRLRALAALGAAPTAASSWCCCWPPWSSTSTCSRTSPRASSRSRTPAG